MVTTDYDGVSTKLKIILIIELGIWVILAIGKCVISAVLHVSLMPLFFILTIMFMLNIMVIVVIMTFIRTLKKIMQIIMMIIMVILMMIMTKITKKHAITLKFE